MLNWRKYSSFFQSSKRFYDALKHLWVIPPVFIIPNYICCSLELNFWWKDFFEKKKLLDLIGFVCLNGICFSRQDIILFADYESSPCVLFMSLGREEEKCSASEGWGIGVASSCISHMGCLTVQPQNWKSEQRDGNWETVGHHSLL